MALVPDRIKQLFMKRFGPLPLVGLVAAGTLFILGIIFEDWVSQTAVPYVEGGLRTLLTRPVGLFGLLVFVLLVLVIVVALVDTSPTVAALKAWRQKKVQPGPPPVPLLSAAERESVHRLRTVWNLKGELAAERLHHLYAAVVSDVLEKLYWSELLQPMRDELNEAKVLLAQAFANPQLSQAVATEKFNRLYRAYVRAAKWLTRLDRDIRWTSATLYASVYRSWRDANRELRAALVDLHEWPEYKGQLAIEITSADVRDFLDKG